MDDTRFDAIARTFARDTTRRRALGLAAGFGAILALGQHDEAEAKNFCHKNGTRCKKKGRRCKSRFCLRTPFTIEARWSSSSQDHDSILYVPNEPGNNDPFPYIDYGCLASETNNGTLYPFAFVSGDAQGPGDEVATVRHLLAGRYEFWGRIHGPAASGDLTIRLRNADGKVIRAWASPPNPASSGLLDWHVFDFDGAKHSVTVAGEVINGLFSTVRADSTYVCPA